MDDMMKAAYAYYRHCAKLGVVADVVAESRQGILLDDQQRIIALVDRSGCAVVLASEMVDKEGLRRLQQSMTA